MDDCLFCKIIKGNIPSYKVYEDNDVLVFLDINPSTNGDSLIIPKKHFTTIEDIDLNTLNKLEMVKKIIYQKAKEKLIKEGKVEVNGEIITTEKLNCKGLTFAQNNGLGQEIKHFHIHATPRYDNDLIEHNFNKEAVSPIEETFDILTK